MDKEISKDSALLRFARDYNAEIATGKLSPRVTYIEYVASRLSKGVDAVDKDGNKVDAAAELIRGYTDETTEQGTKRSFREYMSENLENIRLSDDEKSL